MILLLNPVKILKMPVSNSPSVIERSEPVARGRRKQLHHRS
jgi:hypothetical protein